MIPNPPSAQPGQEATALAKDPATWTAQRNWNQIRQMAKGLKTLKIGVQCTRCASGQSACCITEVVGTQFGEAEPVRDGQFVRFKVQFMVIDGTG